MFKRDDLCHCERKHDISQFYPPSIFSRFVAHCGVTLKVQLLVLALAFGAFIDCRACLAMTSASQHSDPFLWLEDVSGEKALAWVRSHNEKSLAFFKKDSRFAKIEEEVRKILLANDRLPYPALRDGWVYNFWQDNVHVRGIWRRAKLEEYVKPTPQWHTILDLDALATQEKENWVWAGVDCLPPKHTRCLLRLSRGGKDASVVREFDVETMKFVPNGFEVPEAKSRVTWKDENSVFVGTDFGPGSLTDSGYPRIAKLWERGTPLASATTLLEGQVKDVDISPASEFRPEGNYYYINRAVSFFESEVSMVQPDGSLKRIPFPTDSDFRGVFQRQLLAVLRSDWKVGGKVFASGSVISLPLEQLSLETSKLSPELIYQPDSVSAFSEMTTTKSAIYLGVLHKVQGKILRVTRENGQWITKPIDFPEKGALDFISANEFEDTFFVQYDSFLTPSTIYQVDGTSSPRAVKQLPERFDAKDMIMEQHFSKSPDGTEIPYFSIHKKDLVLNGTNPTYLSGYGGFEIPLTPYYLGQMGKVWLASGGVAVIANIRGGGEFGPKWHQAVLTVNRQKAFDDFTSVAKDLIARKVTSAKHLGIRGGSNGGLLMGAAFTQHPELYNAVLCEVPLLDMLRYHKLLAGASWMAEYGDPEDPAMAKIISAYSPYQNVRKGVRYPKVFFYTSTKDDRVHPGHARKMAARMEEQGHSILYYENIEGGHGGAANLEQQILKSTMQYTYLFEQLKTP